MELLNLNAFRRGSMPLCAECRKEGRKEGVLALRTKPEILDEKTEKALNSAPNITTC